MNAITAPQALLTELLGRKTRPEREKNLNLIHQICKVQHETSRDFSIATVGKLCEAAGGLKARALYNAASSDYRALIEAWRENSAAPKSKSNERLSTELSSFERHLLRVDDPALRSLLQRVYVDRNKLRAELNMLKSMTVLQIDQRPSARPPSSTGAMQVLTGVELTESERLALLRALSAEFLSEEGWREGPHGEILNGSGRKVFDIGFTRAIRKVLTSAGSSRR